MAVVRFERVKKFMEDKNLPCWKLFDRNSLAGEQDDENLDVSKSADELEDALSDFETGTLTVELSEISRAKKRRGGDMKSTNEGSGKVYSFNVRALGAQSSVGATGNGGGAERFLREIFELRTQMTQDKHDLEMKELRKEIELAKKTKEPELLERMLTRFEPLLAPLAGNLMGIPIGNVQHSLNGPGNIPTAQTAAEADEQFNKVKKAILVLKELDPKLGDHLLTLAEFATLDINSYNGVIPALEMQVQLKKVQATNQQVTTNEQP